MKIKINFLRLAPFMGILSIFAVLFSLYLMFWGKGFRLGTDFKGGVEFTVTFEGEVSALDISKAFERESIDAVVQAVISDKSRFFINTSLNSLSPSPSEGQETLSERDIRKETESKIKTILYDIKGKEYVSIDQIRSIGGVVSSENTDKAFKIVLWVILVIIAYITFRFKFEYGLAAILAVGHDVAIMLGALVLTNSEVNVYTITAVLTIFGYSVNDTIILFDRIREYLKQNTFIDFKTTVNEAINSILSRTLITSITTLVVVTALFYNSQGGLHDFSFALIIGLVVGTYSSIYVATNFILFWNRFRKLS